LPYEYEYDNADSLAAIAEMQLHVELFAGFESYRIFSSPLVSFWSSVLRRCRRRKAATP